MLTKKKDVRTIDFKFSQQWDNFVSMSQNYEMHTRVTTSSEVDKKKLK